MRFSKDLQIERAMVIYAHPDDAEFMVAGTVAKWAKAGVEVTYCMITNGASGTQDPKMTRKKLRDIRYAEQRKAAKVLGVKHVVFLGYEDGYLYPTLEVRKDVARQVRIHKPDVIVAMDPQFRVSDEYINHPDHIAAGEVALRTINPDASTRQMFPELWRDEKLEPHKPKALFLETFGDGGTVIDITDTMETKIKALLLHRSQLGPEAEGFVRDWNKRTGKPKGYRFGESFTVILLDRPPAAEAKPRRRRARSAVAASRGGAGARRSAPRTSRPRAGAARAAKRSGGRARRSR